MAENNNDKLIDIALEEYKTLRAEILTLVQNRNSIIIFGFAGLVTLISVGLTVFSSSLAPWESNKKTTTDYTYVTKRITSADGKINIETTSPYTVTETEQLTADKTLAQPRQIISAIIFIFVIPMFCMYITFHGVRNTRQIYFISNYIANNIETKLNVFYLKQDYRSLINSQVNLKIMPLNWETLMSTQRFPVPIGDLQWLIFPYGAIYLLSIIIGTGILSSFSIISWTLLVIIGLWIEAIFIRYQLDGLQYYRNDNYIKIMKERIEFEEKMPKNKKRIIDKAFNFSILNIKKIFVKGSKLVTPKIETDKIINLEKIVTWKKQYIDELRGLKELEPKQEKKEEFRQWVTQLFWQTTTPSERADEFREWVSQLPKDSPSLPDEAFNRDSIYDE